MDSGKDRGKDKGKSLYELYDWRDNICVSHYPLPKEKPEKTDVSQLMGLLEENRNPTPKALYIHIPFCDRICSFCPFNKVLKQEDLVTEYIKALKQEMASYARMPYIKTSKFAAVNFGGGTPSSLTGGQLTDLIESVKNNFVLTEDAVISMEGSTTNFSEEKLEAVRKAGVSRVSFGIQTFQQELREIMGLEDSSERCKELLLHAREIGYENLCIDLIYNLPGQTMQEWMEDIYYAVKSEIPHITLFALCMVPGTKLQDQIIHSQVPNVGRQNDEIDMFVQARERLREAGYIQYSIWDFAKPGKIDVNPLLYYNKQSDLVGLGPAAFGYINSYMYINKGRIFEYCQSAEQGSLPVLAGKKADRMDRMRGMMAKGLRNYSVDKELFYELFGTKPEEVFPEEINKLVKDGLIEITDRQIRLTDRGGVWGNNVSKEFFEEPETFAWRKSLAKGIFPETEQHTDADDNIDPASFIWDSRLSGIFEKLLSRKPVFIREQSRLAISRKAASYAQQDNRKKIEERDLVFATLEDTPEQFRPTAIDGFRKLGISMDIYLEEMKKERK